MAIAQTLGRRVRKRAYREVLKRSSFIRLARSTTAWSHTSRCFELLKSNSSALSLLGGQKVWSGSVEFVGVIRSSHEVAAGPLDVRFVLETDFTEEI